MAENTASLEYLLQLAKDRSANSRNELVTVINDLFENKSDVLSDREKNLMFKIFEQLLHEVEVDVRSELSKRLADHDDVPDRLVSYLANDEISVAYPILSRSKALHDAELIKIIHERTEEYHLAISMRREVNEGITDALVETGSENVIINLLNNENSKISTSTMEYLVEQSRRVDTFQDPLVHRHDLSQEMAERMYGWVSEALKSDITSKFDMPDDVINQFLGTSTTKQRTSPEQAEKNLPNMTAQLVEQLKSKGMITSKVLMGALNQNEIPLFFGVFAELTQLNVNFIKGMVFNGEGEEIAVACKAIGITELEFLVLLRKTRIRLAPNRAEFSQEKISAMQDFYRTMDTQNAAKALESWRQQANNSKQERGE